MGKQCSTQILVQDKDEEVAGQSQYYDALRQHTDNEKRGRGKIKIDEVRETKEKL